MKNLRQLVAHLKSPLVRQRSGVQPGYSFRPAKSAALLLALLLLSGCVSEQHYAHDMWPFGNPNAPLNPSETAQRALGKTAVVTPIEPQAGNVWPGPVQPMPTLSDIERDQNLPLGQGYTPSLPSPYPPGQQPPADQSSPVSTGPLYSTAPGAVAVPVSPAPGDAR